MKLLLLLFFVGLVHADVLLYSEIENAAEEMYHDYVAGMEHAPSLKRYLGLDDEHLYADAVEHEVKTDLGKKFRETLDLLLEKLGKALDKYDKSEFGKHLKEKLMNLKEKLRDIRVNVGEKARDVAQKIREKVKEFLHDLLESHSKRALEDDEIAMSEMKLQNLFRKLKNALLRQVDREKVHKTIEELFGKGSEMADTLLAYLKEQGEKGKKKLLDFIDRMLDEAHRERRSMKDVWEKVKEYFKNLNIDIKEKYMKFGEWVKEVIEKGKIHSKNKIEAIKDIAREFVKHTKGVSKEVAEEALEFLRPYKKDLGSLWEQVKVAVKDILQKKD